MSMRLYLDDNVVGDQLVRMLKKAGHLTIRQVEVSMDGKSDGKHFIYAIQNGLVALTRDRDDFDDLHNVVLATGGTHPGIFTIRFERDSSNNMKPKHIAAAIAKVEKAGIPLANQLLVLNHWR